MKDLQYATIGGLLLREVPVAVFFDTRHFEFHPDLDELGDKAEKIELCFKDTLPENIAFYKNTGYVFSVDGSTNGKSIPGNAYIALCNLLMNGVVDDYFITEIVPKMDKRDFHWWLSSISLGEWWMKNDEGDTILSQSMMSFLPTPVIRELVKAINTVHGDTKEFTNDMRKLG
jgi:hypothetical protein